MLEQWRPVRGYEGYYEVSDQRRVRSLPRLIGHWRGGLRQWPGRLMKVQTELCRAGAISLRRDGTVRRAMVNKIMAESWPEMKTAPRGRRPRILPV